MYEEAESILSMPKKSTTVDLPSEPWSSFIRDPFFRQFSSPSSKLSIHFLGLTMRLRLIRNKRLGLWDRLGWTERVTWDVSTERKSGTLREQTLFNWTNTLYTDALLTLDVVTKKKSLWLTVMNWKMQIFELSQCKLYFKHKRAESFKTLQEVLTSVYSVQSIVSLFKGICAWLHET